MTKLLEEAIEKIKTLPAERQDDFGEAILSIVDQRDPAPSLSDAQIAEVRKRIAMPHLTATDDEANALFRKLTE